MGMGVASGVGSGVGSGVEITGSAMTGTSVSTTTSATGSLPQAQRVKSMMDISKRLTIFFIVFSFTMLYVFSLSPVKGQVNLSFVNILLL